MIACADSDADGSITEEEVMRVVPRAHLAHAVSHAHAHAQCMHACSSCPRAPSIQFTKLMMHDYEKDIGAKPWEKYGVRDMHTSTVLDRKHQVRY